MEPLDKEVAALIRKYALQNALEYDGEGQAGSVMGRVLGENPDLRSKAKSISPHIQTAVAEANSLAANRGLDHLRDILSTESPDALEKRSKERREGLPTLPGAIDGGVVLRFAPNPNGPLSLGHSRGVCINAELAHMHDGEVILRFDDTDSRVKPPDPEAYDLIEEEFTWLAGRPPDRVIRASDRMPEYLRHGDMLLTKGAGYACTCSAEDFRILRMAKEECPCRDRSVEENLNIWKDMRTRILGPGDAVLRVRTRMDLPNPALRDWPAWRIQHEEHPMVGKQYGAWPLLDFQSAVEDHLQGVTHIVRGKDLMDSTRKQVLLYESFGWTYPETLYWGRVKVHGLGSFSTSEMRKMIETGERTGWEDPRLPTIRSMRRRGYGSESIRRFWIELGLTQKDIAVPLSTLDSIDGGLIDDKAKRRTLVRGGVSIDLDATNLGEPVKIEPAQHPDLQVLGHRDWPTVDAGIHTILVEDSDLEGGRRDRVRLKDFADVSINGVAAEVLSLDRGPNTPIVHWLPKDHAIPAMMLVSAGEELLEIEGWTEPSEDEIGDIVQFERVGYARLESRDDGIARFIKLHG